MMARRVVLGTNSAGQVGIFVSKPGWDAWSAPEAQLLFSSRRRHFMIVQSGTVVLGDAGVGRRVNFLRPPGQVPLVLCGNFNPKPSTAPVRAVVDSTGFTAYPAPDWQGNYPAANDTVRYYAILKSE